MSNGTPITGPEGSVDKPKSFFKSLTFSKVILVPGICALVALPFVLGRLNEAEKDYQTSAEEVRKGASFWLDINEKYRDVLEKEFDQLLQLTKDSVDSTKLANRSLRSASIAQDAFNAALHLYRDNCRLIFGVDDAHMCNPWPPPENLHYAPDADRIFDTLCTLQSLKDQVRSSVAAIANFKKSNDFNFIQETGPRQDNEAEDTEEQLTEEDLFAGICIKFIVARNLHDADRQKYCDSAEALLSKYKTKFLDTNSPTDALFPTQYPDDLPTDQRKPYETRRCKCFYHYLKGRLADLRHQYRAAIVEYEISKDQDSESRNDPNRYRLIFYRPDYSITSAFESLLHSSSVLIKLNHRPLQYSSSMDPLDQWWKDLEDLAKAMTDLRELFRKHQTLDEDPGSVFVALSSIEWSAYAPDASYADWNKINDVYYKPLLKQIATNSSTSSDIISFFRIHRLVLKTIQSRYRKNYIKSELENLDYKNSTSASYIKPEIDVTKTMVSALSNPGWRAKLTDLRSNLDQQETINGIPLGISLRIRGDIDDLLSTKDDSAPVTLPIPQSNLVVEPLDSAEDTIDENLAKLQQEAREKEKKLANPD